MPETPADDKREVVLALQGGGAHGSFSWGVVDRLLEEGGLVIRGASGTSAGAMNACALAQGLREGPEEARRRLKSFWELISELGETTLNPFHARFWQSHTRYWNVDSTPLASWFNLVKPFTTPYHTNPFALDPLREAVQRSFDFTALKASDSLPLWLCATDVQTNRMRLFRNAELSVDAVLASACLPRMHRAIQLEEADGTHYYWDGGFIGNPVLKPLIRHFDGADIIIVQVNPIYRADVPKSAQEIDERLSEVTFNAALMRELDTIATINNLVARGTLTDPRYRHIRLHVIAAEAELGRLGHKSKFNTAATFLHELYELGRQKTTAWLAAHKDAIGRHGTLDLERFPK